MDKVLIRNYNELVAPDDEVYITGDFSIKTQQHKGYLEGICQKLNGRKHLIAGNHDVDKYTIYAGSRGIGFFAVHYPVHFVEEFVLCHDPALSQADRTRPFVGGHIHDLFLKQKNFLNVGVDLWDFKPVSIDQVRECFKDDLDENGRMKIK